MGKRQKRKQARQASPTSITRWHGCCSRWLATRCVVSAGTSDASEAAPRRSRVAPAASASRRMAVVLSSSGSSTHTATGARRRRVRTHAHHQHLADECGVLACRGRQRSARDPRRQVQICAKIFALAWCCNRTLSLRLSRDGGAAHGNNIAHSEAPGWRKQERLTPRARASLPPLRFEAFACASTAAQTARHRAPPENPPTPPRACSYVIRKSEPKPAPTFA